MRERERERERETEMAFPPSFFAVCRALLKNCGALFVAFFRGFVLSAVGTPIAGRGREGGREGGWREGGLR